MEFKVNKIDTDIRKKIQEEVSEEKIHSSKSINIKKDIKEEKHEQERHFEIHKYEKQYFTIDGVKCKSKHIDINAEKVEEINEYNSKGRIFDTTK